MSQSNAGPHPFLRRQKLPRAQDADMPEPAAAPPGLSPEPHQLSTSSRSESHASLRDEMAAGGDSTGKPEPITAPLTSGPGDPAAAGARAENRQLAPDVTDEGPPVAVVSRPRVVRIVRPRDVTDDGPPVAVVSAGPSAARAAADDDTSNGAFAGRAVIADVSLRQGDTGILHRHQAPRWTNPITTEQIQAIERQQREERERQKAVSLPPEMHVPSGYLKMPRFLTGPTAGLLLVGALALFGLFAYAQLLFLVVQLATLPVWCQYLTWIGLALLITAVLAAMARLGWLYLRLRRMDQVSLRALRELSERSSLRRRLQAAEQQRAAVGQLQRYLEAYAPPWENASSLISSFHDSQEFDARLKSTRERLLSPTHFASSEAWLREFLRDFQSQLDELARARIEYHARRVAIKTAVSPYGLVDAMITVYYGLALMGDLCRIYALRIGRAGTAVLLAWVFFQAYVAGRIDDMQKAAEPDVDNYLTDMLTDAAWLGDMGAKITARVTGKITLSLAAGTANYIMFRRLGSYAIGLLQPVDSK